MRSIMMTQEMDEVKQVSGLKSSVFESQEFFQVLFPVLGDELMGCLIHQL